MRPCSGRLLDLVGELDRLGKEPTLAALGHAMQRANLTPADVAAYVQPTVPNYNRVPVVVRDAYDLLVMTWLPGQASVPHDHSGSICAMQVVQGEATEGCYQVAADGYVDLEYETALRLRRGLGRARRRRPYRSQFVPDRAIAGNRACVFTSASAHPAVSAATRSPSIRSATEPEAHADHRHCRRGIQRHHGGGPDPAACLPGPVGSQGGPGRTTGSDRRRGGLQHAGIGSPAECTGRTHERLARSPGRFCSMGFAPLRRLCSPPISCRASGMGSTSASRC